MKHRVNINNRFNNFSISVEVTDDGLELEEQVSRVLFLLNNIDDLTPEDIWSIETHYDKNY